MRRYHRWLSVIFGVALLWIAVTGVLSQIGSLINNGGFERETEMRGKAQAAALENAAMPPARAHETEIAPAAPPPAGASPAARAATAVPAKFVCPADMNCRPKQPPGKWNVGFLHHIHSGEQFGPAGVVISLLSGLAMIFFSFSGLWMYIRMFRNRRVRSHKPGWFWK